MQATKLLTKPGKQRKMVFQAPDHVRHKFLAAHLSVELRTSHGIKSLPVRSGDTVHVMRGDHKGVEGKITRVDLAKYRIYVEGLTREKVDGTAISVPIHPSKVIVTRLNLDDKWRKGILDARKERRKRTEKMKEELPIKAKVAKKRRETPEEKPRAVVKVEEAREEQPVLKEKPTPVKAAKPKRKTSRKKAAEKTKTKDEVEKAEKPKSRKRTLRGGKKTSKKTEEGED